jgi:hypothetical protein
MADGRNRYKGLLLLVLVCFLGLLTIIIDCSGPGSEQLAKRQAYFSFLGLTYGDSRNEVLKLLGPFRDNTNEPEAAESYLFFDGGVEVKFDALDRVEMFIVKHPGATKHIEQLRLLEPKLQLWGKTAEDVMEQLGSSKSNLIYDYSDINGPNGKRRAGTLIFFCLEIESEGCSVLVIHNQWIYP